MKFVANLLTALGRSDLILIAEAPAGEQGVLISFLKETFNQRTRDEWVAWFADKDVAFAPVLDFAEALTAPQIAHRGLLVEHDGAHQIAPAIRFADDDWQARSAPELGAP